MPEDSLRSPRTQRHSYSLLVPTTLLLQAAKKDLLKVAGLGWLAASVDSLKDLRVRPQPASWQRSLVAAQACPWPIRSRRKVLSACQGCASALVL